MFYIYKDRILYWLVVSNMPYKDDLKLEGFHLFSVVLFCFFFFFQLYAENKNKKTFVISMKTEDMKFIVGLT